MITREQLCDLLEYNPGTRVFLWKMARPKVVVGSVAGHTTQKGYREIKIYGRIYKAHRLAWLYVQGIWPKEEIDHRNGKRDDNRLTNLREATKSQNLANSKGKKNRLKGANFHKRIKKWQARVRKNGKLFYLGIFDTEIEAHRVYLDAAKRLHGDFARPA